MPEDHCGVNTKCKIKPLFCKTKNLGEYCQVQMVCCSRSRSGYYRFVLDEGLSPSPSGGHFTTDGTFRVVRIGVRVSPSLLSKLWNFSLLDFPLLAVQQVLVLAAACRWGCRPVLAGALAAVGQMWCTAVASK